MNLHIRGTSLHFRGHCRWTRNPQRASGTPFVSSPNKDGFSQTCSQTMVPLSPAQTRMDSMCKTYITSYPVSR